MTIPPPTPYDLNIELEERYAAWSKGSYLASGAVLSLIRLLAAERAEVARLKADRVKPCAICCFSTDQMLTEGSCKVCDGNYPFDSL